MRFMYVVTAIVMLTVVIALASMAGVVAVPLGPEYEKATMVDGDELVGFEVYAGVPTTIIILTAIILLATVASLRPLTIYTGRGGAIGIRIKGPLYAGCTRADTHMA